MTSRAAVGWPRDTLLPAWALSQRQALEAPRMQPPTADLEATDLAAAQPGHLRHQTGATGVEILRTEDVQAGRRGPAWTS